MLRSRDTGWKRTLAALLIVSIGLVTPLQAGSGDAGTASIDVRAGTNIYVVTQETLVGKKKQVSEGQVVACQVWRDVVVDGHVVIAEGTPVYVKVDEFKKSRIAGRRGKIALGAYEVQAVDGSTLRLGGGYLKQGKNRIARTAVLAGLVLLPLIFLKGKAAELPRHTVFDAHIDAGAVVEVGAENRVPETGETDGPLGVAVDYERLETVKKPKVFDLLIRGAETGDRLEVSAVNGAAIPPIPLENVGLDADGRLRATVEIKPLSKQFRPGLNRFTVSTRLDGQTIQADVLLEIEI
ncbi:hypothetical protein ABI59_11520 [Acidobacteria bacterium Mor1]|nr:hypothetical protein ABI59_11520 [Acidobacteria bacterium Mor1]